MLTRPDIQALKTADTIVLRHLPGDNRRYNGRIQIFDGQFCNVHSIDVDSVIMSLSGQVDMNALSAKVACHCRRGYNMTVIETIVFMLHKDDEVRLHWYRNNNTGIMYSAIEEAGLVSDECRLEIRRGKRVYEFLIETRIWKDNSSRMITVEEAKP